MKNKPKRTWLQNLNKQLRQHLTQDANVLSLAALQRTVNWQAEKGVDCWECRRAASESGLTVPNLQKRR